MTSKSMIDFMQEYQQWTRFQVVSTVLALFSRTLIGMEIQVSCSIWVWVKIFLLQSTRRMSTQLLISLATLEVFWKYSSLCSASSCILFQNLVLWLKLFNFYIWPEPKIKNYLAQPKVISLCRKRLRHLKSIKIQKLKRKLRAIIL